MVWEFEKNGEQLNIRPESTIILNTVKSVLNAAESGLAISYNLSDLVEESVQQGRLIRVLQDWCQPFPGYYLYYPSRHHRSLAFSLFVEAMRYDPKRGY